MATDLPVVVEVAKPDGSQELVRVGTARRDGAYFVLDLSALRISPLEEPARAAQPQPHGSPTPPPQPPPQPPSIGGTTEDLEYIAARARRTLADPSKARWHEQEKMILAEVERELERHREARSKTH